MIFTFTQIWNTKQILKTKLAYLTKTMPYFIVRFVFYFSLFLLGNVQRPQYAIHWIITMDSNSQKPVVDLHFASARRLPLLYVLEYACENYTSHQAPMKEKSCPLSWHMIWLPWPCGHGAIKWTLDKLIRIHVFLHSWQILKTILLYWRQNMQFSDTLVPFIPNRQWHLTCGSMWVVEYQMTYRTGIFSFSNLSERFVFMVYIKWHTLHVFAFQFCFKKFTSNLFMKPFNHGCVPSVIRLGSKAYILLQCS